MINDELRAYLSENLSRGFSQAELKQSLLSAGWLEDAIDKVLLEFNSEVAVQSIAPPPVPPIDHAAQLIADEQTISEGTTEPERHSRVGRKWTPYLIISGIFLLVGISAVSANYILRNSGISDQDVLLKMQDAMRSLGSYQTGISVKLSAVMTPTGEAKSPFGGNMSPGNLQFAVNATTSMIWGESASSTKLDSLIDYAGSLSLGGFSMNIDGAVNTRALDETTYVRVIKFPQALSFIVPPAIYQKWVDKWISINKKETDAIMGEYGTQLSSSTKSSRYSPEERAKASEMLRKDWPFLITRIKDTPVMSINNEKILHYDYTIDRTKFHTLLEDSLSLTPEQQAVSREQVDEYIKTATDIFASSTGQLLIGQKSYYLYKLTWHTPIAYATSSVNTEGSFDIDMRISNFNAVPSIVAPTQSTPLMTVIEAVQADTNQYEASALSASSPNDAMAGSALLVARSKARDAVRISDVAQISLGLELYYDMHQQYPKTLAPLALEQLLQTVPSDPLDKTSYSYTVLRNGAGYAIGASLERSDNTALSKDADQSISAFKTSDARGCRGEKDRYCYDVKP